MTGPAAPNTSHAWREFRTGLRRSPAPSDPTLTAGTYSHSARQELAGAGLQDRGNGDAFRTSDPQTPGGFQLDLAGDTGAAVGLVRRQSGRLQRSGGGGCLPVSQTDVEDEVTGRELCAYLLDGCGTGVGFDEHPRRLVGVGCPVREFPHHRSSFTCPTAASASGVLSQMYCDSGGACGACARSRWVLGRTR